MLERIPWHSKRIASYIWAIVFAVILVVFFVVFKKHGVEIQIDSTSYIRGALNLKAGLGFTHAHTFINHYPAGLSFIYYVLMLIFPASIYTIALYLNLFLLACIGLLFKKTMQELGIAEPIQLIGFILFILSPPIILMGAKMLTELPSTFLIMASVYVLCRKKNQSTGWKNSLLIGILLGAGILIRFAMFGVTAGIACYLVWINRQHIKNALLQAIFVISPSVLFLFTYSFYIKWRYQNPPVDRVLIWHPIPTKLLLQFFKTPLNWLIQYQHNPAFQTIIIGLVISILTMVLWLQTSGQIENTGSSLFERIKRNQIVIGSIIISTVYCAFIAISITLFDGSTPVDTRILSIISMFFYLGGTLILHFFYRNSQHKKRSLLLICIVTFAISWPSFSILSQRYKYPACYNAPNWQNDAKLVVNETSFKWIRPNCEIYTNSFSFWQLCNDREIKRLPDLKNEVQKIENTHFLDEMIAIRNKTANNKAQIIYFYDMPRHPNKVKKQFIDSFFSNTNQFNYIQFNRGIIIEAKE